MNWFTPWPEAHIKKEKEKARLLRKTQWWDQQLDTKKCHYCKNEFLKIDLTMDHKIPIVRGGMSTKSNVAPCCKSCNSAKKHQTDVEFLSENKTNP